GGAGGVGVAGVHVEAVRALRRAGDGEGEQLAVLARDLAVVAADDGVELDEALELRRRELFELPEDLQVGAVVVVAHGVPPVGWRGSRESGPGWRAAPQSIPSSSFAASDMRLMSHGGAETRAP